MNQDISTGYCRFKSTLALIPVFITTIPTISGMLWSKLPCTRTSASNYTDFMPPLCVGIYTVCVVAFVYVSQQSHDIYSHMDRLQDADL